ncbi:hypothetical protein V502_04324 [Pseudogymnoascus sp. VKM F-4520 (FW-2644)]|nr:hypothetical protein V502_04324 [Pseudogymnoascus sp. VKM F-4520 (FW-2644)]
MSQMVPRGGLRKGRRRHREAFLRLARSKRKALSRQIAHATVARGFRWVRRRRRAQEVRSKRSILHLDRSDDQNVDAQRARCHHKELGGMEGAVIGGGNSRLWLCEAFMCHCGFSAAARPSRGIRWEGPCSVEGAEGAKRRTMSAAGARKLGGRSDGGEGQSRGREWPFYRT